MKTKLSPNAITESGARLLRKRGGGGGLLQNTLRGRFEEMDRGGVRMNALHHIKFEHNARKDGGNMLQFRFGPRETRGQAVRFPLTTIGGKRSVRFSENIRSRFHPPICHLDFSNCVAHVRL
ncbi:hypothetical protein TNCV_5015171 [Trichonephila clavipes]|nr:hypothetical protein TNCV_5015171 [Trichonephila clavipes]